MEPEKQEANRPEGENIIKKTSNTNAPEMPRPVGLDMPAQKSLSVTDGDFSLTLNFPLSLTDGTAVECRKRFKLLARCGDDGKTLVDAWFAYELDLCSAAYWGTCEAKTQRAEMRNYGKLTKRRALWGEVWNAVNWMDAEAQAAQVSEPASVAVETQPAPVVVKTLENMVNGTKIEISKTSNGVYFVTRYEFFELVGWRQLGKPERYARDCLEFEFDLSGDWESASQAAEPAAVETEAAAEPETSHNEPKAEQAARPEGRKPMNVNFDFFAGCENEDAARKRYYQLSKVYHPDTGIGDTETMKVITDQYQAFMGRSSVALDIPGLPAGVIALPEHCETPAAVDEAAEYVDALAAVLKLRIPGVECEICGSWIWVAGLNAEMKDAHAALKAAGYRFSGGKKMWYWVPSSERGHKKRYRGTASMGYIRTKYGSRKLSDELSA